MSQNISEAETDEWVWNEDVPEPVASTNKQLIDVVQLATTLENVNFNPPEVEVSKKKHNLLLLPFSPHLL